MIVVPVIPDKRVPLQGLLDSMNQSAGIADPENSLIPFARFKMLHSCRLLIIDSITSEEIRAYELEPHDWPASLAILGEVDGTAEEFMALLAIQALEGLTAFFSHCEGFHDHINNNRGSMLAFMQSHSTPPAANYINWIGRTVLQINEEARLQASLSKKLSIIKSTVPLSNVREIRQLLLNHAEQEIHHGSISLSDEQTTPLPYRIRNLLDVVFFPLCLLLLLPIIVLITPFVLWQLRRQEKNDPDINTRAEPAHVKSLSRIEDFDVTNQFNVFGDIKPGLFRLYLLKFIMRVVDYFARHIYKRGFLARVRSIHFARWVFLNNNRSMFFASTYDGSLESYMDDFINKVAFGLNLTFSHGVGYPRTRWMIKGGAENEQEFKNTLRRHQLPSAVWYRAYPGLTATDMARNARIRQGLHTYPKDDNAIRQWLGEL